MGAAVARCLRHDVMVHSVHSYTRRDAACSAMKPSSALVREVVCSQWSYGRASGRDPDAKGRRAGNVRPTLEHATTQAAEWLVAGQGCSRR
jgi:hypothetical protein